MSTTLLKKNYTFIPRLVIYLGLIISTFIFLCFSSLNIEKYSWWQEFWINLSAGSLGTLVTVTLVDYFISMERNLKFKAINEPTYYGFIVYLKTTMMDVMIDFGYIRKKDKNLSNLEGFEKKFRAFIEDNETVHRLDNLSSYEIETLNFIKKTTETFKKFRLRVSKSFKEFVPYANPVITQAVSNELVDFEAQLKACSVLLEGALVIVPKKSRSSQKDISVFNTGMRVLWNMEASGQTNPQRKNLKSHYIDFFKLILDLEKKARKRQIHFDI